MKKRRNGRGRDIPVLWVKTVAHRLPWVNKRKNFAKIGPLLWCIWRKSSIIEYCFSAFPTRFGLGKSLLV